MSHHSSFNTHGNTGSIIGIYIPDYSWPYCDNPRISGIISRDSIFKRKIFGRSPGLQTIPSNPWVVELLLR